MNSVNWVGERQEALVSKTWRSWVWGQGEMKRRGRGGEGIGGKEERRERERGERQELERQCQASSKDQRSERLTCAPART